MDEPGGMLIPPRAARNVSAVVDAIDGRIDWSGDNVVGGGERIAVFCRVRVYEIEYEGPIPPLLLVGNAGDEGASRLPSECADFSERAATGLIWPNDLTGDVPADVLAHFCAAVLRGGLRQGRGRLNTTGRGRYRCGRRDRTLRVTGSEDHRRDTNSGE